MKKISAIITLLCLSQFLFAQCDLNPTVTPADPILCPSGTDTLWTEEFESYQWLKGNNPISGATDQFYVVDENDVLKKFKVVVTQGDCTDTSSAVLVDGYVFLLPFVIESGDLGYYDPQLDANVLCHGDTMILTMGLPYDVNVQWYDSGNPISGATSVDYYVAENGSFTVCGSPDVCPNYTDCMLIPINVFFGGTQPIITLQNDTLFSTEAELYQWYLDGDAIPGATNEFYVPTLSGDYTVGTTDQYNCSSLSEPVNFIATNVDELEFSYFIVSPNPANDFIQVAAGINGDKKKFFLENSIGQIVFCGAMNNETTLDVSHYECGIYFLIVEQDGKRMMKKIVKE